MKFPSTLLAQIAGKSDPKDVEREVQKADLDLLAKMNEIAGGNILTLSSAGYREKVGDNYDLIAISTGANQQVVTLATGKQVQGRQRTYAKADSGAGEVKLSCTGTDVIYYAGGTATAVYVGLQYQSTTLLAISGGYLLIGGVTQVVSGEPSLGTPHPHGYQILTAYDPASSPTTLVVSLSGQVPAGAKMIYVYGYFASPTVGRNFRIQDTSGYTWIYCVEPVANLNCCFSGFVALDSSRQFQVWSENADISGVNVFMATYYL